MSKNVLLEVKSNNVCFEIADEKYEVSNFLFENNAFYDLDIMQYFAEKYPQQRNIIDIHSDVGNHVVYFANHMSYEKIYCFEPNQNLFNVLQNNVKNLRSVPFNCASGPLRTKCEATINESGFTALCKGQQVDMLPLDDFNFIDVTFLRISSVNFANQIVLGALKTILIHKPIIMIETNNSEAIDTLQLVGYKKDRSFYKESKCGMSVVEMVPNI